MVCVYVFFSFIFRAHDSDIDSSDLEKRNRKDKDAETSKSKKKHKKHKKNKKSKKHDGEGKERSKKHKKHHKRSKSSDGNSSDSNVDVEEVMKIRNDSTSTTTSSSRHNVETKLPPPTTTASTLNTKFTEIMKSNGHVVVAKAPLTKFNNGNGADTSKRNSNFSSNVNQIPTDPSKLVEFITKSLDPNTSTQVVSSASDSDTVHDVDSPDVAVIEEDDLNLEELMRQKALLQARLGGCAVSDTESENSHKTPVSPAAVVAARKMATGGNSGNGSGDANNTSKTTEQFAKLKRPAEPINDVILLDDSSNEASEKPPCPVPKKKSRNSRSRSRERAHKDRLSSNIRSNRGDNRDNRDNRDSDKMSKTRRSDVENRFKEDLRKEIDRDKERNRNSPKSSQRQNTSLKTGTYSPAASKSKSSTNEKSKTQTSFREREVNKYN